MADFVKLNGYYVKDAQSRQQIENLNESFNEFKYDVKKYNPNSLTSIYQGNYIVSNEYLPSAVLKIGNTIYTFNASNSTPLSDTGKLIGFDVITNRKTIEQNILMSHANSVCYDNINDVVYIVPTTEYSTGDNNPLFLYTYNSNFEYLGKQQVPEKANAISYDNTTNKLYMKSSSQNMYVYENNEWVLLYPLNLPELNLIGIPNPRGYNQGMAIHNGMAYISCPYRNVVVVDIENGEIINSFVLTDTDNTNRYILKELEDFEFTADGHLLAMRFTILRQQANLAFVVELPVNHVSPYAPPTDNFDIYHASFNLDSNYKDVFAKTPSYLSSLLELRARVIQPATVIVQNDFIDDYNITLMNDLEIQFTADAKYTCKSLEIYSRINLRPLSNSCRIIFTGNSGHDIMLLRKAQLSTSSGFYMYMTPSTENGDIDIYCGSYFPLIMIFARPRIDGTGNIKISTDALGSKNITSDLKCYLATREITLNA